MKHYKIILVILMLFVFVYPVLSENPKGQREGTGTAEDPYILPQTSTGIKVDGKLDEKAWENALLLDMPNETWPGENTPSPVRTDCYLTYDRSNLYVGVRAYDPDPSKIRAFYYERDKIIFDDMIVVFLDTFNDERRAYGFRSNPMGVQFDDIRSRIGASLAWDAIYDTAGKIYDWGYIVEMKIPFNQLRFQHTKKDQIWGINVRRIYPRLYLYHLDHIKLDRNNFCLMCQFVKVKGFKGARPSRNIELVPTLTGLRTDERASLPDGKLEKRNSDIDPGITARWGVSSNMTLIATVNPDFSQVEADSLKLDINEPFALSYEERRPFFYEGADYFNTNFDAVYTRTLRDPSWGLKLTGQAGGNTLGAYIVRDTQTNLIFPGSHSSSTTSLLTANISSVFRYKRDFSRNFTIGALATDREGDDYFNRMGGIDGDVRISKKDRLQFQLLGSSTQYPDNVAVEFDQDQGSFTGTALDVIYNHDTRNWDLAARYQDLSQGFRADLGFMPQVNYRKGIVNTGYTWYGKRKAWFRQLVLTGGYRYSADQDGNLINSGATLLLDYRGPMLSYITLQADKFRETYFNTEFDQFNFYVYFDITPTAHLEFAMVGNFGDRIDYANVRLGKRIYLNPVAYFKPGRHMILKVGHVFEHLKVDDGRLYTANISYMSGAYHFSVRTFFRAILQYVNYNYNTALYGFPIDPEYKRLVSQFLFSYKINPRTVFFLGYSDNYLGNQDFSLTQKDRTFFAKLSYAWSL